MNRVSTNKRIQVVSALVEGNCIGAIVRDDRYAKHTVLNPLRDLGCACAECHHRNVWSLEELMGLLQPWGQRHQHKNSEASLLDWPRTRLPKDPGG